MIEVQAAIADVDRRFRLTLGKSMETIVNIVRDCERRELITPEDSENLTLNTIRLGVDLGFAMGKKAMAAEVQASAKSDAGQALVAEGDDAGDEVPAVGEAVTDSD